MKALILAAGYGKRLRPITDRIPKSMAEVAGTPLLVNALHNLTELGIRQIGIVVGHMADYIRSAIGNKFNGAEIAYYENPRYRETNNIYSLYKALDFFDDDSLMLECDIFYRADLLRELLTGGGVCSILVSPFNPETMDGSVIRAEGDKAMELVLGKWQGEGFDYTNAFKTVNMYKFTRDFMSRQYAPLIRWYVENVGENIYYEKVLGSLIYYRESDIRIVKVPEEMWCEIDNEDDLFRANRRFRE